MSNEFKSPVMEEIVRRVKANHAKAVLLNKRRAAKSEARSILSTLDSYFINRTRWPSEEVLDRVSLVLSRLAQSYRPNQEKSRSRSHTPWSNISLLNRKVPGLRVKAKILSLIKRAAERMEDSGRPEIERIKELSQSPDPKGALAKRFLDAIRRTRKKISDRANVDWGEFFDLLFPKAKIEKRNECRARASEIEVEWLLWVEDTFFPSDDFAVWVESLRLPVSSVPKIFAEGVHRAKLERKRSLAKERKARQREKLRHLGVTD